MHFKLPDEETQTLITNASKEFPFLQGKHNQTILNYLLDILGNDAYYERNMPNAFGAVEDQLRSLYEQFNAVGEPHYMEIEDSYTIEEVL
jgi:hypothetical protein